MPRCIPAIADEDPFHSIPTACAWEPVSPNLSVVFQERGCGATIRDPAGEANCVMVRVAPARGAGAGLSVFETACGLRRLSQAPARPGDNASRAHRGGLHKTLDSMPRTRFRPANARTKRRNEPTAVRFAGQRVVLIRARSAFDANAGGGTLRGAVKNGQVIGILTRRIQGVRQGDDRELFQERARDDNKTRRPSESRRHGARRKRTPHA